MYQLNFSPYLNTIKKRKKLIILVLLLIVIPVSLLLSLQKPIYKSTAVILIEPDDPNIVGFQEIFKLGPYRDYYQTQYHLMSGRPLIEKTLEILDRSDQTELLKNEPTVTADNPFMAKVRSFLENKISLFRAPPAAPSNAERMEHRIKQFQKRLTVEPVVDTRLVNLVVLSHSPYEAVRNVNTLAEVYVEQNLNFKLKNSKQASTWLTNLVDNVRESLKDAEQKLKEFVETRGFVATKLDDIQNVALEGLRNLNVEYMEARIQRLNLETRLDELKRLQSQSIDQPKSLASTLSDSVISGLLTKYSDLKAEEARLSNKFRSHHPTLIGIRAELKQISNDISSKIRQHIQSISTELRVIQAKEQALVTELDDYKSRGMGSDHVVNYMLLKSDVESKRSLYQDMLRRSSETDITKGLNVNNVRIVQRGVLPVEPVPSSKVLKFFISSILALGIGVSLAFLFECFDRGFKSAEEVEHYLEIPLLGLIPRYKASLTVFEHSGHQHYKDFAFYRLLRTNIQFITEKHSIVSVLVTSTLPNEGKSTTTANLGVSFALLGKKVLLVDADLYRPSLHHIFKLNNAVGLTDAITTDMDWQNTIQQTDIRNLNVLTTGELHAYPTEILSSNKAKILMEELKSNFDIVLYDSPMIHSVPDTSILAVNTDGVLLVHNIHVTNKDQVYQAKQVLDNIYANIIGIVFNDIKFTDMQYYVYQYDYGIKSVKPKQLSS